MSKNVSGVVQRGLARDALVRDLRRMIVSLELPPGAVITEENLCALLGCSRTPLREALQLLAAEHLVVAVPRRGVSIAELGVVEFGELVQAHEVVETFAMRCAAERITDEALDCLDQLIVESEEADAAGDSAQVVDLDFQIHTAVGVACGNRYLSGFQATLLHLLGRYIYLGFQRAGNAKGAIDDHRHIVDALRSRDPDVAEDAMKSHVHNGRERMRAAL
jgi:DNA-binding GntR family transcriptional regulator